MRFRTRAFLLSFVPFAILLTSSFWIIQHLVQSTVRDGLRTSLRENHLALSRVRQKSELHNRRFLKVVGENAALKAGIQLLLLEPQSAEARLTVEDQLRELCERMGFDFLSVSAPGGTPLAAVTRAGGSVIPVDAARVPRAHEGLALLDGRLYRIASVPMDQSEENLGLLSVGEYFSLSEFTTPAVLIASGRVLQSSIPGAPLPEIEAALKSCSRDAECDVRLRGASYVSLPIPAEPKSGQYALRSFQNVEAALAPVRAVLQQVFLAVLLAAVVTAVFFSMASSTSIVKPIASLIDHLRAAESTGVLPDFSTAASPIQEIRDLTTSFNSAAASVREAREDLQRAYIEAVGSLANALDARDRYTAGHSKRVSDLSCSIALAMKLDPQDIERIRVGAVLHDIGKIGIPDAVLQKPGKLNQEEYDLVTQHPLIGRRILEGVNGFAPYLAAVELHHENWDGTGYPFGQLHEQTCVDARIIHISDAYDAMTSDRPYRRGMSHEQAIEILLANAGTQFDPHIVSLFAGLSAADLGRSGVSEAECELAA